MANTEQPISLWDIPETEAPYIVKLFFNPHSMRVRAKRKNNKILIDGGGVSFDIEKYADKVIFYHPDSAEGKKLLLPEPTLETCK